MRRNRARSRRRVKVLRWERNSGLAAGAGVFMQIDPARVVI